MAMGNIRHISISVLCMSVVLNILFNNLYNLALHVVANDQINQRIFFQLLFGRLHIAAHSNNDAIWVLLLCPMHHLSGLTIRHICYCTGIDHVNGCLL